MYIVFLHLSVTVRTHGFPVNTIQDRHREP